MLMLLWLWCRLAAIAPIGPLAWEPPYAIGYGPKKQKKKKKKKKKKKRSVQKGVCVERRIFEIWTSQLKNGWYLLGKIS